MDSLVDVVAEEAILGAMIVDQDAIPEVVHILKPSDFSQPDYQVVYQAIADLYVRNVAIDLLTVHDRLRQSGHPDPDGRLIETLGRLVSGGMDASHVSHYADIIKRLAVKRAVKRAGSTISGIASDGQLSAEETVARAEQALAEASIQVPRRVVTLRTAMAGVFDRIDHPVDTPTDRIFTGIPGIDGPLLGIETKRLWVGAAVSGTGKSALSVNLVRGTIVTNPGRVSVLYFCPEQSEDEITSLILSAGTESMPPIRIKALQMSAETREMFVTAAGFAGTSTTTKVLATSKAEYLQKPPSPREINDLEVSSRALGNAELVFVDPSDMDIYQMLAVIRRERSRVPPDIFFLVIVDGAHLIKRNAKDGGETAALEAITRGLKVGARNLVGPGGAVVANTQLTKEIYRRDQRTYKLSDLRGTGGWGNDADVVFFLDRESVWSDNNGTSKPWDPMSFICRKNRQTSTLFVSWLEMNTVTMKIRGRDVY